MITKDEIVKAVNEILEGTDKFLVDVVVQPSNRIAVYIDGDRNITILDCREVNHALEGKFDRDREDFDLTVSSYGIDRPLILNRQFRKNVGRELELATQDGRKISGVLAAVRETTLELEHPVKKNKKEVKRENTVLPLTEIKTAKIIIKIGK